MLILTSNVGSRKILSMARGEGIGAKLLEGTVGRVRGDGYAKMRSAVKGELGKAFRPEFLNRLDEVIVFEGLRKDEVRAVAGLMLDEVVQRCAENEITLRPSARLSDTVVEQGFSTAYGARPLRRAVQRLCEDSVAEAVLSGFVLPGGTLEIDADRDGVTLTNGQGKTMAFEPSEAQGIEDDFSRDEPPDAPADSNPIDVMQMPKV